VTVAAADAQSVVVERWSNAKVTWRAFLALLLLFGFYILALAIVGLLLVFTWIQWQVVRQGGRVFPILALISPLVALGIVFALLPRTPAWHDPGPRLNPKRVPALFDLLREISQATRQKMPRDVYITNDLNAGVYDRGWVLGRAMILGLPLLGRVSVGELRAIAAHEFGHYAGRDSGLGLLVYRAMYTLAHASAAASVFPFLNIPFALYAELFLRLAMPISRQQELRADELACRVAGIDATVSGLTRISDELAHPVAGWEPDPFDTHPPLRDRVANARRVKDAPNVDPDNRPARTLVEVRVSAEVA
jgi:Zn-dependent protease with chaperone function